MNLKHSFLALTVIFSLATGAAFAQDAAPKSSTHPQAGMGGGMGMMMMKQFAAQLELTQEQQDRMKAILGAAKDWMQQHRAQHQEQFKALIEEFKKDKMDETMLDDLAKTSERERLEARIFMRQTLVQIHRVLTPEQRVKAAEKLTRMMGMFMNMGGPVQGAPGATDK